MQELLFRFNTHTFYSRCAATQAVFKYVGLPFDITAISGGPFVSTVVVALALNKLTMPIRIAATGAIVPTVAKRLRKRFPLFAKKWLGLGPKPKPPLQM